MSSAHPVCRARALLHQTVVATCGEQRLVIRYCDGWYLIGDGVMLSEAEAVGFLTALFYLGYSVKEKK